MISLKASRKIFLNIYNNEALCDKLDLHIKKHALKFKGFVLLCKLKRWEWFLKCDPFTKLCLVYAYLPNTKAEYLKQDISDDIFYATMDDIRIWIDDHYDRTGEYGLYELNWIMLHMSLQIFKLGRLQFQKWFYYDKCPYNKNGKSIKLGDRVLNIHIPRGEKLDIDECRKSIASAQAFFSKHYTKYSKVPFICHSWLLYSENKQFMDSNSNIIKFKELFDTVNQNQAPSQAILWLFGNKVSNSVLMQNKEKKGVYIDTDLLKNDTKLQKRAIEYINSGGTLGDAYCVLK